MFRFFLIFKIVIFKANLAYCDAAAVNMFSYLIYESSK